MTSSITLDEIAAIARDICCEARAALMTALRFMDRALWHMPFETRELRYALGTDGHALYIDPLATVARFRHDPDEVIRDYLHAILHCVFRHPFDDAHDNPAVWDISCDIAVEATAMELCGVRYPSAADEQREEALETLRVNCPQLTAQRLYQTITQANVGRTAKTTAQLTARRIDSLIPLFARDDHGVWARESAQRKAPVEAEQEALTEEAGDIGGLEADEAAWRDISGQIEIDMQTFFTRVGTDAGTFTSNLSVANRKVYDYKSFLRRFSTLSEEMRVSDEEFDYIFYTYGLRTYGNVPLVEPLEYQDRRRVRDFVIALDTSGSCAGDLMRNFVEKTYDILKSSGGFGHDINVHVIQCDTKVQSDVKIEDPRDIDRVFRAFTAKGFGGTDFRPVFAYVDELVEAHAFTDLKGLIYLTDGLGAYPSKPTAYATAFVFVEAPDRIPAVPPWAMKVIMNEDEIYEL